MNNKEKNNNFNWKKGLRIFTFCILLFASFAIFTKQNYTKDYSIAVRADVAGDTQKAEEYYSRAINDTMGLNPYPLLGLGKLYSFEGKYSQAKPLIIKALEISRRRYASNDLRVVNATYALGTLYSREGKYQDAELFFNTALKLVNDENIKLKSDILQSLGELYLACKDYKKSEEFLLKAFELQKKLYKEGSFELLENYTDLGILYTHTGQYKKSEHIFKILLNSCNATITCKDSDKINIFTNLGGLYFHMGKYEKAQEYSEKAMNLYNEKTFHSDIATVQFLYNLGLINYERKNTAKSLNLLHNALKLSIQINGENSNLSKTIKNSINKVSKENK